MGHQVSRGAAGNATVTIAAKVERTVKEIRKRETDWDKVGSWVEEREEQG